MYATPRPHATRAFIPRDIPRISSSRSRAPVLVTRSGHGHGHGTTMTENEGPPKFLDELRQYAMALHTKEQAPGSGKAEAPKERKAFQPTKAGVLRFYEESKIVYDAFEEIVLNVRMDRTIEGGSLCPSILAALSRSLGHPVCRPSLSPSNLPPAHPNVCVLYRTPDMRASEAPVWSVDRPWPRILTTWSPPGT